MSGNRERKSVPMKVGAWFVDYFQVVTMAIRNMGKDNVAILASGMVYSTLIALVPCITFLSAFLSAFGGLQTFMEMLGEWLNETFGTETGVYVLDLIASFSRNAMSLGVVGLISFIITGLFLVNKIYSVINSIFRSRQTSGLLKRYATFFIFLVTLTILISFAFALSSTLEGMVLKLLGMDNTTSTKIEVLKKAGSVSSIFVILFLILEFVPNAKIRFSASFSGALVGTLSLLAATFVFTNIIRTTVKYSVIYGAMAAILLVLLYMYIIWYIVIIVAEITYIYQFRPEKGTVLGHPITAENQLTEAINILVAVSKKYTRGDGATSIRELTTKTQIPQSRLVSYLRDFEECRLVMSTNSQGTAFVPARPTDKILVSEVIDSIFSAFDKSAEAKTAGAAVAKEFKAMGLAGFKTITIEELLKLS